MPGLKVWALKWNFQGRIYPRACRNHALQKHCMYGQLRLHVAMQWRQDGSNRQQNFEN